LPICLLACGCHLNMNSIWFFIFKDATSIFLLMPFYILLASYETFTEILRISEKDWKISPQFDNKFYLFCKLLTDTLMLKNILRELRNQLSIILGDSKNLPERLIHVA
jgi:hypothetical protein